MTVPIGYLVAVSVAVVQVVVKVGVCAAAGLASSATVATALTNASTAEKRARFITRVLLSKSWVVVQCALASKCGPGPR